MSPAATLRAAATKLRETASNATPGPWQSGGYGATGWTIGDGHGRLYIETEDSDQGKTDAAWIALMSPAVAEPLAAWLDGVAKDIDGHDPDGGCECTESDSYHRAMDFAAAILGRTS